MSRYGDASVSRSTWQPTLVCPKRLPQVPGDVLLMASRVAKLQVVDLLLLNKTVARAKQQVTTLTIHATPPSNQRILAWADASFCNARRLLVDTLLHLRLCTSMRLNGQLHWSRTTKASTTCSTEKALWVETDVEHWKQSWHKVAFIASMHVVRRWPHKASWQSEAAMRPDHRQESHFGRRDNVLDEGQEHREHRAKTSKANRQEHREHRAKTSKANPRPRITRRAS
eukprot:896992-Amphidinium_carterae.1